MSGFLSCDWIVLHCMCSVYLSFVLHSIVDGHLGWFHALALVNCAAVNMEVQASVSYASFNFFTYMPRRGRAESSIFKFLRTFHAALLNAILSYIPTNSVEEFCFLHLLANMSFLVFLTIAFTTFQLAFIYVLFFLSVMFFFKISLYSSEMLPRDGDIQEKGEILHPLFTPPDGYNDQGRTRQKPRARSSTQVFHMGTRLQDLGPSICHFPRLINRELDQKPNSWTQTSPFMGNWYCRWQLNLLNSPCFLFKIAKDHISC